MVEIHVYNVISQVFNSDVKVDNLLHDLLSFRSPGYVFSPAYRKGTWDGFNRLYLPPTPSRQFGKFWTGLLFRATNALSENNIDFTIIDKRLAPLPSQSMFVDVLKKGFQDDAVEAVVDRTRGIVRVATGGGKTPIAAKIFARLNLPSIFIVHKLNLLKQARESFKASLKIPIGIIQANNRQIEKINVATIQTLDNILWSAADGPIRKFVQEQCRVLIVDEAHHAGSTSFKNVLQQFTEAYYRIGLTATPQKHDGMGQTEDMQIEAAFGRIIFTADRSELQEKGDLAKSHAFYI